MKLYHGTNQDIEVIDLSLCLPNKDFGQGTSPEKLEAFFSTCSLLCNGGMPLEAWF